jgi:nucleoid-associated protein YgaU
MAKTTELFPINTNSPVISQSSRYNYQAIYRDEKGKTFLQTWKPREFSSNSTTQTIIVNRNLAYRPDLISDKVYGTPLLWWAICYVNDILNPLDRKEGLYPGRLIKIPDSSVIYGMGT